MYIWWSILTACVCCFCFFTGIVCSTFFILIFLYSNIVIFTVCCFPCYLMAFDSQELKGLLTYLLNVGIYSVKYNRHQSSMKFGWPTVHRKYLKLMNWMYLTGSVATNSNRSTALCGEAAGGCTGQVEHTLRQSHCTRGGHYDSITVSPRVTRLGITVGHAPQHVTLLERPLSRRGDGFVRSIGWVHPH